MAHNVSSAKALNRKIVAEYQRKYKARKKAKLEKQQLAHVSDVNVDNDNSMYLLF